MKRRKQQNDQGSRQIAISTLSAEIEENETELRPHLSDASRASSNHKSLVRDAQISYEDLSKKWEKFHQGKYSESGDAIELIIEQASAFVLQMSSDYHQDKKMPIWNLTPQPGLTYYMRGITQYFHIFCLESCGQPKRPTRRSRNLLYIRDERVGGQQPVMTFSLEQRTLFLVA